MNVPNNLTGRVHVVLSVVASFALLATILAACSGPSNSSTATSTTAAATTTSSGGIAAATPGDTATAASTPTTTTATATTAATSTGSTNTPTPVATSTGSATTTNPQGTPSGGSSQTYLDDRSSAEEVIRSYYNAINSKEYDRAYSYWESGVASSQLPPYDQFKQGYANTLHVDVTFGSVSGGVAAGNYYYSVPTELVSKTSDKGAQTFVGCYTLHLGSPANQTVPPYQPMAIEKASIQQVDNSANVKDLLAKACSNGSGNPDIVGATPATGPDDISANVYLDNRSSGPDVIRSYYNAINSQQYARAYSYWESNLSTSVLPAFPQFKQGYQSTKSVKLTTGKVTYGAGAGQRYESVPVTIVATATGGSTQTFVGCYTTHLAVPVIQDQPPFQPMAIQSAKVNQVDNNADTATLMAKACQQP